MPIYDYECRNCGHRVEVIHGVNASGPTACAQCGGAMRKRVTSPSIVFRGSGWAKKDRSAGAPSARQDGDGSATPADGPSKGESAAGEGSTGSAEKANGDKPKAKDSTSAGGSGTSD